MMHRHRTVSDINGSLLLRWATYSVCDRVLQVFGIEHSSSCPGSLKKSMEGGRWSAGSARQRGVPRMSTPSWWRDVGRRVQVNGGSLSLVQNGIYRFINDPNSRMIAAQPRWNVSAIRRARRTSETTVNPPGSPNRVRPEYDPLPDKCDLTANLYFRFSSQRARSPSQMMYGRNPSDRKTLPLVLPLSSKLSLYVCLHNILSECAVIMPLPTWWSGL